MTGGCKQTSHTVGGNDKTSTLDGAQKQHSTRMRHLVTRLPITHLNPHLTCALCSGYLVDATTVVECLHSFCRACLLRYLETSGTCPICDTQINKAQLHKSIRADNTLQDLVYKLVPSLYKNELRRRKDFYLDQCKTAETSSSAETGKMQIFDKHLVELSAFICTPDEVISFSLETVPKKKPSDNLTSKEKTNDKASNDNGPVAKNLTTLNQKMVTAKDLQFKRYFRCPAAVTVGHLKKLLAYKMDLPSTHQIDILHTDEALLDEYTLMDIAYIYTWRRKAPMQLFFNVCKFESEEEPMPLLEREVNTPPSILTELKEEITNSPKTADQQDKISNDLKPTKLMVNVGGDSESPVPPATSIRKASISPKDSTTVVPPSPTITADSDAAIVKTAEERVSAALQKFASLLNGGHTVLPNVSSKDSSSMRGKPPINNIFDGPAPIHRPATSSMSSPKKPSSGLKRIIVDAVSKTASAPPKRKPKPTTLLESILQKSSTVTAPIPGGISASLEKAFRGAPKSVDSTKTSPITCITRMISGTMSPPAVAPICISDFAKTGPSPPSALTSPLEATATSPTTPTSSYQQTAAQSACTQPAKLRLKKSLSSVVQQLNNNALEGVSPVKKAKIESGNASISSSDVRRKNDSFGDSAPTLAKEHCKKSFSGTTAFLNRLPTLTATMGYQKKSKDAPAVNGTAVARTERMVGLAPLSNLGFASTAVSNLKLTSSGSSTAASSLPPSSTASTAASARNGHMLCA